MPGAIPVYDKGPVTFEANVAITGGQLVSPDAATGRVKPSDTASGALVLGVATNDAIPAATSQAPVVPGAPVTLNVSPLPQYVAVASEGVWNLTASATGCAFGVRLKAGTANGTVVPWVSGTDASNLIVGIVYEPAGITNGQSGQVKLTLV
jgi:hypothetical protein